MTKSSATCWNTGRFIGVIVRGRRTGQTVDEVMLPRRQANKSQPSRCDIFPLAASLLRHHYVVLLPISTAAGFGQGSG